MRAWKLLGAALAAATCGAAWADGGFFAPEQMEVRPAIPDQRAFLAHKNGIETLIVESVLDAPAGDYAWVIPVPSKPIRIEPSTNGALSTLETLTPPTIDGRRKPVNNYVVLFAAAVLLLAVSAPHRLAEKRYRASRFVVEVVSAGFCACLASIFMPSYSGSMFMRGEYTATDTAKADFGGVIEHAAGNVGSYRYAVVSSPQGVDNLLEWLKDHKFGVPAEAKPAIDGYVKKGWKFFVATLRHDGGQVKPHPIRLVFPTSTPVYPMALTSAIGGDLKLDLYVVGGGTAEVSGMQVWRAERLSQNASHERAPGPEAEGWQPVGHPELTPSFWEGAVLTRLRGKFGAHSLGDDLIVRFGTFSGDYIAELKTDEAAGDEARSWAVVAFCLAMIGLGAAAIELRPTPGPMWLCAALAAVVGLSTGGIRYLRTERVDSTEPAYERNYAEILESPDQIAQAARDSVRNDYLVDPEAALRRAAGGLHEDVPGGTIVQKTPFGYRVTQYGRTGAPLVFELDSHLRTIGEKPR